VSGGSTRTPGRGYQWGRKKKGKKDIFGVKTGGEGPRVRVMARPQGEKKKGDEKSSRHPENRGKKIVSYVGVTAGTLKEGGKRRCPYRFVRKKEGNP